MGAAQTATPIFTLESYPPECPYQHFEHSTRIALDGCSCCASSDVHFLYQSEVAMRNAWTE
jgi:hypothetical protein